MASTPTSLSLANDFDNAAAVYSSARVAYEPAIISNILDIAGVNEGDTLAEIGAGTGLLTKALLKDSRVKTVYCVEPSDNMRLELEKNFAAEIAAGRILVIAGSAEQTNLPAHAKPKLIIGGDVAHLVQKPGRASFEFRQKLADGGKVAFIVRYPDHEHKLVQHLDMLLKQHIPSYSEAGANHLVPATHQRLRAKQGKLLAETETGGTAIKQPLPYTYTKDELFNFLSSRSSTTYYFRPKQEPGQDAATHEQALIQAKQRALREILDPLFDFAKKKRLLGTENGVEKIPFPRTLHISIGAPKNYPQLHSDYEIADEIGQHVAKEEICGSKNYSHPEVITAVLLCTTIFSPGQMYKESTVLEPDADHPDHYKIIASNNGVGLIEKKLRHVVGFYNGNTEGIGEAVESPLQNICYHDKSLKLIQGTPISFGSVLVHRSVLEDPRFAETLTNLVPEWAESRQACREKAAANLKPLFVTQESWLTRAISSSYGNPAIPMSFR